MSFLKYVYQSVLIILWSYAIDKYMKILNQLLSFTILLVLLFGSTTSEIFAQTDLKSDIQQKYEASSSYELFYPVTAGKLPGDFLYILKIFRENIIGVLTFDAKRKVEYKTILSQKRLVEAEALLNQKNYEESLSLITNCVNKYSQAVQSAKEIKEENGNFQNIYSYLTDEGEKELVFLTRLSKQFPEQNQKQLSKDTARLEKSIQEIK